MRTLRARWAERSATGADDSTGVDDSTGADGSTGADASTGEDGAAVVEFVMMSVLLVLLLFTVLQVAVYCYARNVVAAAAADAARYAATAGVSPGAGDERARELIQAGLNAHTAAQFTCTTRQDVQDGLPVTTVHCKGRMRALLAPADIPIVIDVTADSLTEPADPYAGGSPR